MNNDLEQFSEERLMELIHESSKPEIEALARIALSVKQAKAIGYVESKTTGTDRFIIKGFYAQNIKIGDSLYTTPQPAHTEQVVPDGWKLVPIEPTDEQLRLMLAARYPATFREYLRNPLNGHKSRVEAEILIVEVTNQYKNALAAAPKPESE